MKQSKILCLFNRHQYKVVGNRFKDIATNKKTLHWYNHTNDQTSIKLQCEACGKVITHGTFLAPGPSSIDTEMITIEGKNFWTYFGEEKKK